MSRTLYDIMAFVFLRFCACKHYFQIRNLLTGVSGQRANNFIIMLAFTLGIM